jgi:hypothetical protein
MSEEAPLTLGEELALVDLVVLPANWAFTGTVANVADITRVAIHILM